MLNQVIANMLVENRHHFMIAADMVATVSENNPLSHAFLSKKICIIHITV